MNRTGLLIALGIAGVTGCVFGFFPELDVAIARMFHAGDAALGPRFILGVSPTAQLIRDASMAVVALLAAPAVVAFGLKLVRPRGPMLVPGRATIFLLSTILLGPLLVSNIILKDHWSRPRPRDIVQLGGAERFVAWWDPRGTCKENCSFVAGEVAGAAWTIAPAALAPPQWRALAYVGALAFAAGVGLLRMSFGGHFLSDAVFAGVITFLLVWAMHGVLYRRPSRPSDADIEDVIERFALWLRRPFSSVRGGAGPPPPHDTAGSRSESYSSLQKEPP